MSEKEKRKHSKQPQAPFWIYSIFIFVLLMAAAFPMFHFLRAYPHAGKYQSLAVIAVQGLGLLEILILIAGLFLEPNNKHKWILFIITCGIILFALSGAVILLAWLGLIIVPIAIIILIIYGLRLLIAKRERFISLSESLGLVFATSIVAINIIIMSWYMSLPYHSVNSYSIETKSYHLILNSGFLDPLAIQLYECNSIGLLCEPIYAPNDYYYDNDKINWQITQGENPTITIFVNNEAIYTETLNHPSD